MIWGHCFFGSPLRCFSGNTARQILWAILRRVVLKNTGRRENIPRQFSFGGRALFLFVFFCIFFPAERNPRNPMGVGVDPPPPILGRAPLRLPCFWGADFSLQVSFWLRGIFPWRTRLVFKELCPPPPQEEVCHVWAGSGEPPKFKQPLKRQVTFRENEQKSPIQSTISNKTSRIWQLLLILFGSKGRIFLKNAPHPS